METKTLSVITTYHPCRQAATDNGRLITSTYQQKSVLFDDTGSEMDPRQVLMDDLITLLQTIEQIQTITTYSCGTPMRVWTTPQELFDN
jgi:hypothetical protein